MHYKLPTISGASTSLEDKLDDLLSRIFFQRFILNGTFFRVKVPFKLWSWDTSATAMQSSARYCGTKPHRHLYTIVHGLKMTRC